MHKRWLDGKTGVKTLNGKNVGHQRQTIRAQMLQTASIQKKRLGLDYENSLDRT
jgi:hypothetical protein